MVRVDESCSTPEGVIVSIASEPGWPSPIPRSAQRPRASSSRSRGSLLSYQSASVRCSTPEGVIVSIAASSGSRRPIFLLLNARGRHRLDRLAMAGRLDRWRPAQRPRASSSRSHTGSGRDACGVGLLNARGRHRLDRAKFVISASDGLSCSTPEGVIVSIAPWKGAGLRSGSTAQRPRASSSRSLARAVSSRPSSVCSTPEGVIVSIASCSNWPRRAWYCCSTPEGVIVSIATARRPTPATRSAAQRPRASSSRSHCGPRRTGPFASPAQRPRASSSRSHEHGGRLSIASGCSTPEGVIVSIARRSGSPSSSSRSAQRPRASSSRSHKGRNPRVVQACCSTPEGVIVSIARPGRSPSPSTSPAQRPRASSSRSPAAVAPSRPSEGSAQRPRASSSRSHWRTTSPPEPGSCSTPEGVIVSIAKGCR